MFTNIGQPVIWMAVLMHLIWGISLLSYGAPLYTTTLSDIVTRVTPYWLAAILLITSSIMAIAGIYLEKRKPRIALCLLLPQQFLLFLSMGSALDAVLGSQYSDGVIRPREFILADQVYAIITTGMHTLVLLYMFSRNTFSYLKNKCLAM